MEFEYDEDKNQANIAKHGLELMFGARPLADPDRVEISDERQDYGEKRHIVIGAAPCYSICGKIYVVVYTIRDSAIRLISVRKANAREQDRYFQTGRFTASHLRRG